MSKRVRISTGEASQQCLAVARLLSTFWWEAALCGAVTRITPPAARHTVAIRMWLLGYHVPETMLVTSMLSIENKEGSTVWRLPNNGKLFDLQAAFMTRRAISYLSGVKLRVTCS